MVDYQDVLNEIHKEVFPIVSQGNVADYIPRLACVPLEKFGMAVHTLDGKIYTVGDALENFSVQSISKVYTLTLALNFIGEQNLLKRVGSF